MAKSQKPKFVVRVKSEYVDHIVGFNNSIVPLGQREDLDKLMDIALESQSPSLLKLFSTIPTAEEWLDYKGDKFLNENETTLPEPGTEGNESQSTQTTQ